MSFYSNRCVSIPIDALFTYVECFKSIFISPLSKFVFN